jgi:hypothetical protein
MVSHPQVTIDAILAAAAAVSEGNPGRGQGATPRPLTTR